MKTPRQIAAAQREELLASLGLSFGGATVMSIFYVWTLASHEDLEQHAHQVALNGKDGMVYASAEDPGGVIPDQFLSTPPAFGLTMLVNTLESPGVVEARLRKGARDKELWVHVVTKPLSWKEAAEFWTHAMHRVMQELGAKGPML